MKSTPINRWAGSAAMAAALLLGATACSAGDEAGGAAAEGNTEISLVTSGKFTCAMSGEYRPFNFIDEHNEVVGIDVEVCEAIAADLGVEAEPVTGAFNTLVAGLQANRYDAVIGSMAITEERAAVVDFSDPYYETGAQLFVQEGSPVASVEDLSNATIGVTLGTTFEEFAGGLDGVSKVTTYQSDVDALRDLNNGRLDGVITQELIGKYQIKQIGLGVVPVGDILYPDVAAIPVNAGNTALLDAINESLAKMREDGRFDAIMDKWFEVGS